MIDLLFNYIQNSSSITIFILLLLSVYFILSIWIFVYKYMYLNSAIDSERKSLASLIERDLELNPLSKLSKCLGGNIPTKELLKACEVSYMKEASSGLSWLSIISSTSPFIGLFGTVVGILESFAKFANQSKVGFATIAPAISEALVATAGGILVAIFAYTFHQIIVRKVYELNTYLKSESQIVLSRA